MTVGTNYKVQMKYYKVICKNSKNYGRAPTLVECDHSKFWKIYSIRCSKNLLSEVFHIERIYEMKLRKSIVKYFFKVALNLAFSG